jgi:PAS domain S-box-containing protein
MPNAATSSDAAQAEAAAVERRAGDRRAAGRRSSQAVLRQIVDRLADGIVIVAADGRIRFANPAAQRLFGRPASALVGQEFGYPLATDDTAEIEIVRRGSDAGVVVAELRVVDALWDDERATLVSLRDVTDRKQAEEHDRQLERERAARAEAEAANQAKSDFLAVMSHELRTPLNAVLGYAELLDLGVVGALTTEQRQQLGRITASGRHLLGLVNEILDFAKVEAGRLTVERVPTSANDVVEAAVVLAQPQAEARGLAIETQAGTGPGIRFLGDHDRVMQILANLLSNSVKFTNPGGTIRIDVDTATTPVSRHLHGEGRWVVIRVTDTGIGIAPEQIDAVFSPFVQAQGGYSRERDGTGLGLTISRRLARLMGGDVVVNSVLGQGSEFALWLPESTARTDDDGQQELDDVHLAISPRTRGLGEFGDAMLHESEAILDAFVAQLRREPTIPEAAKLGCSQLADHVGALIADIGAALVALDESEGSLSSLLHDTAAIQRFIADRHGLQRARLGWTSAAMDRESAILLEEVRRAMCRCFPDDKHAPQFDEAMGVICRYLEQAGDISRRALERAARQSKRAAKPTP